MSGGILPLQLTYLAHSGVSKLSITVEIAQRELPKIILKRPASSASQQPVTRSCRRCTAPHDSYVDGQAIKDSKDAAHALPLLPLLFADHDAFTIVEYPAILLLPVSPSHIIRHYCLQVPDVVLQFVLVNLRESKETLPSKRGTSSSPKFHGITSEALHINILP